jgi:hypothetical protein
MTLTKINNNQTENKYEEIKMSINLTFKFLRSMNNKQLNELNPGLKQLAEAVKKEIERRRKKRIPRES